MYPAHIQEYFAPSRVEDALELISQPGHHTAVLAGGQSLIRQLKARVVRADRLVDITRVTDLDARRITHQGGALAIGFLVRHSDLRRDPTVARCAPALAEAAGQVGDLQVRNRGTVGGSLAHADQAGDYLPVMLALGASVIASSTSARRSLAAEELFVAPSRSVLRPDELLTEVRMPVPDRAFANAYRRHSSVLGDHVPANVCTHIELNADGQVALARVAVGGLGQTPRLLERAALVLLAGGAPADAGQAAVDEVTGSDKALDPYRASLLSRRVAATSAQALRMAAGR